MCRGFDSDSRNVLLHSQLAILEIMDGNKLGCYNKCLFACPAAVIPSRQDRRALPDG